MKTQVFETISGPVVKMPNMMGDRKRSFRRHRAVLGKRPVVIDSGRGYSVFVAMDSVAALLHFRRLQRFL